MSEKLKGKNPPHKSRVTDRQTDTLKDGKRKEEGKNKTRAARCSQNFTQMKARLLHTAMMIMTM